MKRTWKQRLSSAFFGTILGVIIPSLAMGQATLLPNAKQQYLDGSGAPVANGQIFYYVPPGTTKKTVWQDAAQTTPQANPVQLDGSGRPQPAGQTYGSGVYRQLVVDANGLTIWDAVTSSTGSASGASSAASEGVMVGTITAWAGAALPNHYLYTAGQAISRTTYPDLLVALTFQAVILCQSGVATISVSSDISDKIPVGAGVEASCFAPGTTVASKASGTLTLSTNATSTASVPAKVFPWGNGDGSTTFNVPELRGRALVGRNNMNGTPSSVLTSAFYQNVDNGSGVDPNAINAAGGSQFHFQLPSQMPSHAHTATSVVTDPQHNHALLLVTSNANPPGPYVTTPTNSLTTNAGGSVTGNNSTGITVTTSMTNTGGSGASSTVQPSRTADYIIKALPDDSPTGPGVSSIQGMTGALACGAGVICTGNTISSAPGNITVDTSIVNSGTTNGVLFNHLVGGLNTVGNTASGINGQVFLGVTGGPPQWGTVSRDCSTDNTGAMTCTKTNNVLFAASATTDATNAANISSGTLPSGRLTGAYSGLNVFGFGSTSTPQVARSSAGLNIDEATSTGDANYSIASTDRMVYHTALTAPRTDTLPPANSVNPGQQFVINDFRGVASATNTITLARAGGDTINGLTSLVAINAQYGAGVYWSDGVSRWTFFPQTTSTGGTGTVTQVNCGNGLQGGSITTTGTCSVDPSKLAFGGRLTLISGKSEIDTDVISSQNVWYAPAGKGNSVPIYNGTSQLPFTFTSGPTDQVGMVLNLAGSVNWPSGTIYDVFMTLNGGVPVLATRQWDSGMLPTANSFLTPSTEIVTGTTPNSWTRPLAAFDGTVVKATATSSVLFTSNNAQDANCLGQDWGAGTPQVLSQVLATAPTDEFLLHSGPTSLQVTTYGSNDNANWQILDVRYVNAAAIGMGGTATITVNSSYQTPYRYDRFCVRGDGLNNVNIAQIRFYTALPPSTRRLSKYNGILTNDASMTARINSTTTITVPTNQGTYLGSIKTDASNNGAVSAYVNPGPSRVYNVWNVENQIDIVIRAVINTLAATGVQGYTYSIPANTSWTTIQSATYNIDVLVGYARSPVTASLLRAVYFQAASGLVSGYGAGIAVDTIVGNFSGTQCSGTVDTSGQNLGFQCYGDLVIPPFAGSHLLTAIETVGSFGAGGVFQAFTDIRNTRMQAAWKG